MVRSSLIWVKTDEELPQEGVVVETKTDDDRGLRNGQKLKREGRFWFYPDGSGSVRYTPTHWRPVTPTHRFSFPSAGGQ